jgi:hypothetical protein
MSWTVACFCNATFSSPLTRCPRCGRDVPELTTRPRPAGDALGRTGR